jgi:hypothetical protein
MVTSKAHIRELDKALRNQVSLDAVAKDVSGVNDIWHLCKQLIITAVSSI